MPSPSVSRMSPGSARSVAMKKRAQPSHPTVVIQFVSPSATVCAHCQSQTVSTSDVAAKRSSTVPDAKSSGGQASVSVTSFVPVEMAAKWRVFVGASRSGGGSASPPSGTVCEDGEPEVPSPPVRFCASIVAKMDMPSKTASVIRLKRHNPSVGHQRVSRTERITSMTVTDRTANKPTAT